MTERAQSSGQRDSLMGNQDADLSSDHHLLTKQEENSLEITREISEKEKNDKDGDDDDDDDGVPTDSGWSWVITFSTFTGFVLLAGYDFTMYFLFPDLVVRFDSRVSVMTSMFSIQSICMSVASVFAANVLMPRYSVRVITVGAGLTSALTTLLMSQAPNMGTFLALTALKGLCHGVLGVCPVTLLGFYFKRRRSLAQALANVGLCVGSMAFPSVVQALRSQYGVQGSLMILSSLELHYVAVYLLLRPVESYRKLHRLKIRQKQLLSYEPKELKDDEKILISQNTNCEVQGSTRRSQNTDPTLAKSRLPPNKETTTSCVCSSSQLETNESVPLKQEPTFSSDAEESFKNGFVNVGGMHTSRYHPKDSTLSTSHPMPSSLGDSETENVSFQTLGTFDKTTDVSPQSLNIPTDKTTAISSQSLDIPSEMLGILEESSNVSNGAENSDTPTALQSPLTNAINVSVEADVLSLPRHETSVKDSVATLGSTPANEKPGDESHESSTESHQEELSAEKKSNCNFGSFIDMSLFKLWLFRMALTACTFSVGANLISVYMASKARREGLSRPQTATLSTVQGATDLASRLSMGFIADLGFLPKSVMVSISMGVLAIACQFAHYFTDHSSMMVLACLQGLFGGARHNLQSVILIDYLGVERLAKALSVSMVVMTLTIALSHLIIGGLEEATGEFDAPFYYISAMLTVSSLVFLTEPLFRRLDQMKQMERVAAV